MEILDSVAHANDACSNGLLAAERHGDRSGEINK
jgi:hypothetical protein